MKHRIYFLFVFIVLFFTDAAAQQNRFVYIQTENKQPFYVRINNAVLSSSSAGYLVIPKLKDGTYQVNIGFPKNDQPQLNISFTLNKKDAGFLLKNFGDKGWGLFNLQTMDVIMAKSTVSKAVNTDNTDNDPFTQVLSDVVNTPDLKNKPVPEPSIVKEQPKKEEPVVVKKEEPKKEEPVVKAAVETRQSVKLLFNNRNDNGREMAYIDEAGNDTIRLFIPAPEKTIVTAAGKKPKKTPEKTKEKFIDIELPNPNTKTDTSKPAPVSIEPIVKEPVKTPAAVTMVNSDCKANASDEDFMKLRKKMAAADSDEEMVAVAKKGFKTKCYSTSQLKNLSVLFLNDAGRYQFFDAAYPFVYDSGNFSTLQQQLTDPYFITRFQAMIRR